MISYSLLPNHVLFLKFHNFLINLVPKHKHCWDQIKNKLIFTRKLICQNIKYILSVVFQSVYIRQNWQIITCYNSALHSIPTYFDWHIGTQTSKNCRFLLTIIKAFNIFGKCISVHSSFGWQCIPLHLLLLLTQNAHCYAYRFKRGK